LNLGYFYDQLCFEKGLKDSVLYLIVLYLFQKMHVGGIFCDLAKAFDFVNNEILLVKLHYYGIQGTVANWFRSYLTNRKQESEINLRNFAQNGEQ
jgi:hypothetical protein